MAFSALFAYVSCCLVGLICIFAPVQGAPKSSLSTTARRFEGTPTDQFLTRFARIAPNRHRRAISFGSLKASKPLPQGAGAFLQKEHNKFRKMAYAPTYRASAILITHGRRFKMPAQNMEKMYWDPQLAASAQRHADRCTFGHSTDRKGLGENIWAGALSDYRGAVQMWFDEVNDPNCACGNIFKPCCGHFTQVVWATSSRIGCGFAECGHITYAPGMRYVLVCQYADQGNRFGQPAYEMTSGNPGSCGNCPSYAPNCVDGLCQK